MITVDAPQGSEIWHAARAGIPTASNFNKILTAGGKPSRQAEAYCDTLLIEHLIGGPTETYSNSWMERGIELEAEARAFYEFQSDNEVRTVGFVYGDEERLYGASPDGLVGEDGLLEIKCPKASTHAGYIRSGKAPTDYYVQMQGQMLVTERKWTDFVSYFPGLERPFLVRVNRDDRFILTLSSALGTFIADMLKKRDELAAKGYSPA